MANAFDELDAQAAPVNAFDALDAPNVNAFDQLDAQIKANAFDQFDVAQAQKQPQPEETMNAAKAAGLFRLPVAQPAKYREQTPEEMAADIPKVPQTNALGSYLFGDESNAPEAVKPYLPALKKAADIPENLTEDFLNFAASPAGLLTGGFGALGAIPRKILGYAFAGQAIKESPGLLDEWRDADTPEKKVDVFRHALGLGAMAIGAVHEGMRPGEGGAAPTERAGGLTPAEADQVSTKVQLQNLDPNAPTVLELKPEGNPEVLDGLNVARRKLVTGFEDQPPEVQAARQQQIDHIDEILLAHDRNAVQESEARTAQPPEQKPPPTPGAAGETTGSPPAQGGRSSLFSQAADELGVKLPAGVPEPAPEVAKTLEEPIAPERQSPLDQLKELQADAEPTDAVAEKIASDLQKLGRVNRDSTKAVTQELGYYSESERQQLQQHLKTDDAEPTTLAKAITGRDVLKEKTTVSEYLDEPAGKEGRGHPTADVAKEAFGEDYTGGPGAMGPREAAAMAEGKQKVSVANADVNARRAAEGKPLLESEERKANPVTWAEAEAKLEANPDAGKDLVKSLNDGTKTSVNDADGAILIHEMITAKNLRDQWRERAGSEDSTPEERAEAQTNWQKYEKQLEDVDTAARKAGTQAGRALQIRKMQINDDYTPAAMESRLRAAKQGQLTEKEISDVSKAHERIAELEKKLAEKDQQDKYEEAKTHFDKLVKDTFTEAKKAAKAGSTITDFLNDKAAEAKARIIARRGKLMVTVDPLNVAGLVDEAIIGASHIANGLNGFAEWSKAMLDDFGDRIKPYLKDLFDSAKSYHDSTEKVFNKGQKPETPEQVKATIKKGPLSQKDVYDLARAHVRVGADGLDNVMKAVTKDLEDTHPGITEREVRDAFSGYGKVEFPSKEADLAKLREYRRLGQLTSAIEDANAKSAPKKSGMQRDQPTQTIREKMKQLNEAMRANGIETTSPEQQLKTANDARATALRNQIEDLDKRLKTGEKPTGKTPVPPSPEVETLRAERDAMKAKLDELEKGPQKSAEEIALQRYKTAIENRTKDIQDRLAKGDYTKPLRNKVQLDTDAEKLKANYEREKLKFDTKVEEQRLANRTPSQKFWDRFVGIERAMKLSSDVVLAKLTTAAVVREGLLTPSEELAGGAVSKLLPGLAERAPRHGGISLKAEVDAKVQAFTKGMKDAWDNLRMRKSDLEVTHGNRKELAAPAWYDYIGFLHGALKAPIKRAEFARSLSKRMEFAIKNGVDVNDPHVMQRLAAESYVDANRAIFMQDNVVSSAWSAALNSARNNKKYPNLGPAAARIGNFLVPVVRVPTNIVGEVATGVHGAAVGGVRAGLAYLRGIESLPPEHADAIMSQIKKGLVGNAILLTGYLGYKSIGGFYQRNDKRPSSDVQPETYNLGGMTLPKFTGHSTAGILLNIGATLRREEEKGGLGSGIRAAGAGTVGQLPLIPVVTGITDALQTENGFQKYIHGMITSTVTPGLAQHIAKVIDTPGSFPKNAFVPANPRQPQNAFDAIKVGVPGLRQQVPRPHKR